LAADCKEEKAARLNEIKVLEEEKCRSKLAVEEWMIALEEQSLEKEKNIEEEKLALEKEKMVMAPNYVDTLR
jgi:hypothetical protein